MTEPITPPAFSDSLYPPPAPKTSFWSTAEDVLDVCYAPTAVFERRRDGRYLAAFIVICVLSIVIALLSSQVMEAVGDIEFNKAMAKAAADGQKMTPEQIAQGRAFADKFKSFATYLVPLFLALGAWIGGLILMGLSRLLGGKVSFGQASMIALLSSVPEMIERVLVGAQGLMLDTNAIVHKYSFSTNAARFMAADANKWLMKAGALADPFVIWGAVILGIGVYIIGKMEKEKAAVVAVLYTLLFAAAFR
jgi:hypothetical protein